MPELAHIPLEDIIAELRRRRQLIEEAEQHTGPPPWKPLIQATADAFGVPYASLWSEDRRILTTWPRQAAMILMRRRLGMTLVATAGVFRKDHGAVIHAERTQDARMLQPAYRAAFEAASSSLASCVFKS